MSDRPKPEQLAKAALFLLEEAILDVLLEAKRNKECMRAVDVSRRAGIPTEKLRKTVGNAITPYILCMLCEKGKVKNCTLPNGKNNGWELTEKEFISRRTK